MTFLRRTGRPVVIWAALAIAGTAFPNPARAASPETRALRAGDPGQVVDLPGDRGLAEMFSFDERLAPALLALALEEGREITAFPIAPGVRRQVRLVRHEIYAEGARVYRVEGQFRSEVPRSRLVFFWGSDLEGAGNRLFVAIDPVTRGLSGLVHGPDGVYEIVRGPTDASGRHLLAAPVPPKDATWSCAQEDLPETAGVTGPASARFAEGRTSFVLGSLYKGILAIDTDKEYLAAFGNNTTNATNYIATLIANVNVMYERDLNLRLVAGTTILRTGSDPWTVTGSGASNAQLNEFTNYWNLHYPKATTPRSFAAMLSGKSTSGLSGIAWVASSVCGGGYAYSFNQISGNGSWAWGDTLIVGHEIGHNMGSPHTHCYATPAPDHCWANEACYGGPTSCPATQTINGVSSVTGTIMGYCHLLSGCSTSLVFHPATITRYVGPTLDAGASAGCLAAVGGGGGSPPPPVSAATAFNPLTPCRLLDTRNAAGPLGGPPIGGGGQRSFILTSTCGVPSGAVALSANVTVVNPAAQGDLIVYPSGLSAPTASSISFRAGKTRANNVQIYLALDGSIVAQNNSGGALDFVVDVNGYYQ